MSDQGNIELSALLTPDSNPTKPTEQTSGDKRDLLKTDLSQQEKPVGAGNSSLAANLAESQGKAPPASVARLQPVLSSK